MREKQAHCGLVLTDSLTTMHCEALHAMESYVLSVRSKDTHNELPYVCMQMESVV